MDWTFFLVSALAVTMTGISKSGFAGGLGILAVPLMSLFVPPQLAAAIMMPILYAMDIANIWKYRRSWSRPVIAALLPGALAGLALGALTFRRLDADLLKLGVGGLALVFAAMFFAGRAQSETPRAERQATAFTVGALSGLASFVAHAGGPPVKGYLLRRNTEKSAFVGTNSVFFFLLNQLKLIGYLALGEISTASLKMSLAMVPFLVIGVALGFRLHAVISQRVFTNVAYLFLCLAGLKLVWDGGRALW